MEALLLADTAMAGGGRGGGIVADCCGLFSEIVDGNAKMTLGMIWTIILRFAIQDISVEGEFTALGRSPNLTGAGIKAALLQ